MKLSIIDQSPVPAGLSPADALRNSIELAQAAERLGYYRYWIAEHHAIAALASPAPEVLIARVGAATSHMRIGSGGILLPHYSPLKVVETFRMLHALYPGRIDLGIGRAPGGTPLDTYALRRTRTEAPQFDDFPQQLAELLAFLDQTFPSDHPFAQIKVSPLMPGGPEVWLLGSSLWSASAAAQFGLPYAFAHFIDPLPTRQALEHYRAHFRPVEGLPRPRAIVALGAICAATEAQAQRLFTSTRLFRRRIRQGQTGPIPSPEEAERELGAGSDPLTQESNDWPRYVVGTPLMVRERLEQMAAELQLDELMVITVIHDHQARMDSYRLLAEEFGLSSESSSGPGRGFLG